MIRVRLSLSRAANSCGFLDFHGTTDSSKRVLKEATSDNLKFMLRTDGKESIQFKTFEEKQKVLRLPHVSPLHLISQKKACWITDREGFNVNTLVRDESQGAQSSPQLTAAAATTHKGSHKYD